MIELSLFTCRVDQALIGVMIEDWLKNKTKLILDWYLFLRKLFPCLHLVDLQVDWCQIIENINLIIK